MVPETITGVLKWRSARTPLMAKRAALAFSVSNTVSTISRSTSPSSNALTCSPYAATRSSNVMLRKLGSFTSGDMEAVRFVGPMLPATNRGLSGSFAVNSSATVRASVADT